MKIIKPSVEFFGEVPTDYDNALKFIEKCGRLCYKSEDRITPDSAEKFVRKLVNAGHLAMAEHSNFVVRTKGSVPNIAELQGVLGKYLNVVVRSPYVYAGGSLTAWANISVEVRYGAVLKPFVEIWGGVFDQAMFAIFSDWQVCPHNEIPKELHRYSAKFICDRGVSHELVRHRPCSFAQESTRYVNYGGKEMEFIEPAGFDEWNNAGKLAFRDSCLIAESQYKFMLSEGNLKTQQARAVLPNALKTEIVVTADLQEWTHLFNLRCAKSAHPDFVRVAVPLRDKFIEEGLI